MADEHGNEEQEGFGQASLGDAQSSDPPNDPEMIDENEDQDSEPASTEDELDPGGERDQAEG